MFIKKIYFVIIVVLIVINVTLCGGLIIQSHRLEQARQSVEYYRAELDRADNKQQLLAATIDQCYSTTERTKQLLCETGDSIKGLRESISIIKESYQDMEVRLLDCYDRLNNYNNDNKTN